MDLIDKKIFVGNFKGKLTTADLARELKQVASALLKENELNSVKPIINDKQIQRIKQVVWLLEANR